GAGAVSVQFGAAFATKLFDRVGPVGAVTLRLGVAALVLVGAGVLIGRRPHRAQTKRDLAVAVAFGLVLAGMNLSFYEAISRIPLGAAVTIEFAGPLAVALAGSRRWTDGLWAIMAGAGVALLATAGGRNLEPAGIGLAALAGAFWIAYILLSKQTGRRFDAQRGLAIAMVTGAAVMLPAGLVRGGATLFSPGVLGLGAMVALLSSVVPYSLELIALRRVTPRAFGVMLSLDPGVAALAGLAVLGQQPGAREVTAMVLVIAANLGNSLSGRSGVVAALEPGA
ncbi:MAG TPA: EamA family transporter, partial [Solirubrobacterales bacterium]